MPVPHHFPSLVNGPVQAVLVVGSGLSAPNGPTVSIVKEKLDDIAGYLGVSPNDDFYDLAESVLDHLTKNGRADSSSRLWLAEKLGMLDDRRWFGDIGLPLSGNTPRHRAIARFVVEERLRAVISLNWDALLEAALDSVGMTSEVAVPRPWKATRYVTVVDKKHLPSLAHANVFPVLKPHGCVRELERIRNRVRLGETAGPVVFKLTSTELGEIKTEQQSVVDNHVRNYISECPLIGIGWRAFEKYLREAIVDIAKQVKRTESDSFTVVNTEWDSNHSDIAKAYGKDKIDSFVQVRKRSSPTTDCIMQWLQARYALLRMIKMVPEDEQPPIEKLLREQDQPDCDHPIQAWADCWLPTWIRLCWRVGAMQGFDPETNRQIGSIEIPVTPRDAHVPLTGMSLERRDLHAAAKLLSTASDFLHCFRFDLYPGGFFDGSLNCLYLPLPGWRAPVPPADLAALKPLVDALRGMGYVRKLRLMLLNNHDVAPDPSIQRILEAQVRRLMPLTGFASGGGLAWVNLEEFTEEYRAGMA